MPDTQAELAVPLRLGERVIGVLDVQSAQRGVFQTEDILTLQLIADQVAIAIENARLFQETKKRLDAMRALHEVSLDIVGKLELSALLNTLLERAARLVHAESAVLAIYDQDSGLIRNIANYQTVRDWTGFTRRPGEGIVGMVSQTGKPLIINDYAQWSHALAVFSHVEQNAMLCVPLRWHDHVIGALLTLSRPENHLLTSRIAKCSPATCACKSKRPASTRIPM